MNDTLQSADLEWLQGLADAGYPHAKSILERLEAEYNSVEELGMENLKLTQSNAFSALWRSTSDFFLRFLNRYPPIIDQLRVMHEEELEVTQAALTQPENLPSEVADLIVTAMGVMMCMGYTIDDLNAAMLKVAAKNNAKTHETHERNSAGKIARKVKGEGDAY